MIRCQKEEEVNDSVGESTQGLKHYFLKGILALKVIDHLLHSLSDLGVAQNVDGRQILIFDDLPADFTKLYPPFSDQKVEVQMGRATVR